MPRYPFALLRNPLTVCGITETGHVESRHRTAAAAIRAQSALNRACRHHNGPGTWVPLALVRLDRDVAVGDPCVADRLSFDDLSDAWDRA